jgi:hypothetical protein
MAAIRQRSNHPFDIPAAIIPPDLSYQWVDPQEPRYAEMANTGWQPVPFGRHKDFFEPRYNQNGFVKVGGCVLVSRHKEQTINARGVEMDRAFGNVRSVRVETNAQRVRVAQVMVPIILSDRQADAALASGLSVETYVRQWIERILEGRAPGDGDTLRPDLRAGGFVFAKMRQRVPRDRWLAWLFNMISTET